MYKRQAQEQSSLAVSSAAEYVRDAFLGKEMDGTITTNYWTGSASYSSDSGGAFRDFVSYAVPEPVSYTHLAPLARLSLRGRIAPAAIRPLFSNLSRFFSTSYIEKSPSSFMLL